ncbi:BrnT family toxin [Patescibacteria group bacterium AH-259-L05]|nr:BrnT family toxin [Patescibacteria group bacterium AH-259-L05]
MNILEKPIKFEWDEGNRNKNFIKHSVTEGECEEVFFDADKKILKDIYHSNKEPRYILLGETKLQRLLFVVFTLRKNKNRAPQNLVTRSARNKNRAPQNLVTRSARNKNRAPQNLVTRSARNKNRAPQNLVTRSARNKNRAPQNLVTRSARNKNRAPQNLVTRSARNKNRAPQNLVTRSARNSIRIIPARDLNKKSKQLYEKTT